MARIGISITKATSFRNSTQEFSNVYHFDVLGSLPTAGQADSLIDELKSAEVGFHSTDVTFKRGRCWSAGGTKAENNMISQKNLTGTGSTSLISGFDKERAFLFRIRAGNDSRGNAVYLRKWYHSCGNGPGNSPADTGNLAQTTGISNGNKAAMVTAVETIGAIGGGTEPYKLCSKTGRLPDAGANFQSHNFLEHHQLGDQWRAS